jgi:nitrous oxidase accessory protein
MSRKFVLLILVSSLLITALFSRIVFSELLTSNQRSIPQSVTARYLKINTGMDVAFAETVHNLETGISYATIQEAIDANETIDGHTVFVGAGVYHERVNISKSLHLLGDNCKAIIDGDNITDTDVVSTNVNSVTIENFTIRGAGRYGILAHVLHGMYYYELHSVNIIGNIIENNSVAGICLHGASVPGDSVPCWNMLIEANTVRNNSDGVSLHCVENSTICNNLIEDNTKNGITIFGRHSAKIFRPSCTVKNNNISRNVENGIYMDAEAGIDIEVSQISENFIKDNKGSGIEAASGWLQNFRYNVIKSNLRGIRFSIGAIKSKIIGNSIVNNSVGIDFNWPYSSVQKFYVTFALNNFINNTQQVVPRNTNNTWDYMDEGNFWSNYTGADLNHDGIGDNPHVLDTNNKDNSPLKGMFSSFQTTFGYQINSVSNSLISGFSFSLTDPTHATLIFNISGNTGTYGFCRICIPKVLINGSYAVRVDDGVITYPQVRELPCSGEIYTYLYINYTHSEHTIEISGTTVIPEFPSGIIVPLFMITTLITFIVYRKRRFT